MIASDEQASIQVLTFLSRIREQQATFRRKLLTERKGPGPFQSIVDVNSDVECHQYESGLTLEVWLEAQTAGADADALTFWLDIIHRADGWLLDGRVSWNGQDTVLDMPPLIAADFNAVEREAPAVLDELFHKGMQALDERLAS